MSDKELVWVPKHLAAEIESLTSTEGIDAIVARYVAEQKVNIEQDLDVLREYVAIYKGLSATARVEFSAACEEAAEKSYEVFEAYDKKMLYITEKVRGIVETILPVYKELDRLANRLDHVDVARLHSALDLAERIASMSDETRQALTAILGENEA